MMKSIIAVLILNSCLFLGEIYLIFVSWYEEYQFEIKIRLNQRGFVSFLHFIWAKFVFWMFSHFEKDIDWQQFKAIIAAPILEELLYRSIIFGIYRDAFILEGNESTCLYILPIYFAIAHLNTFYNTKITNSQQLKNALLQIVFKLIYTQIFGIYSGWVYIRSMNNIENQGKGIIISAIVLHAQCNWFGFPSLGKIFDYKIYLPKRIVIAIVYLIGIILFFSLKNYLV